MTAVQYTKTQTNWRQFSVEQLGSFSENQMNHTMSV